MKKNTSVRVIALIGMCLLIQSVFPLRASAQEAKAEDRGSLPLKKQRGPVIITGDNLIVDSANKIATYTGNVKVVQGTTSMFSDELMIYVDSTGKKLAKAVAKGNLRLVNESITATGLEGVFYNEEQKLDLNGEAKVWQDNNTITANRITAFLEQEVLEGFAKDTTERAVMTVYSGGGTLSPFAATETAEPTPTPTPAAEKIPEKSNPPIVITADHLRLDNKAKQATYNGNVIATKETTEIKADEMRVYITGTEGEGNAVDKIEVNGNVRITNGTQVVTGVKGEFLNQQQSGKVEGTAKQKARAEDSAQSMILEAPLIEFNLKTKTVSAKNPKTTGETSDAANPEKPSRIRTIFGAEDETPSGEPTPTPTPKPDQSDRPSVTVVPKKNE